MASKNRELRKRVTTNTCDECGYDAICFNPEEYEWLWKWTHATDTPTEFRKHKVVLN